jgi:hypothetical protein
MVGGLVGGQAGAATGAKAGVVVGATRSVAQRAEQRNAATAEAQARTEYQTTAEYKDAPHSNFNEAPPETMIGSLSGQAAAGGKEVVLRQGGKPVLGITYPTDWKQKTREDAVAAVSNDGHAFSAVAALADVKNQEAGIEKIKKGLEKSLQDIKYDEATTKESGALVVTGIGKGKKSGVDLVFAMAVLDSGSGQLVGAAFVVDENLEERYKETVRDICQTVRRAADFTQKADTAAEKPAKK